MKTQTIPKHYQHISPAGAEVRVLMSNYLGGISHCTLKSGVISKVVRHKTVSEIWHVISGKGAIWRNNGKESLITQLEPGMSIDIPLGTEFQYRSDNIDLIFICITMPPWPGQDEVSYVKYGAWTPTMVQRDHKL